MGFYFSGFLPAALRKFEIYILQSITDLGVQGKAEEFLVEGKKAVYLAIKNGVTEIDMQLFIHQYLLNLVTGKKS